MEEESCLCMYTSESGLDTQVAYLYRPMTPRTTYRPEQPQSKRRITVHPTTPSRAGTRTEQGGHSSSSAAPGREAGRHHVSRCVLRSGQASVAEMLCPRNSQPAKMACCHLLVDRHHVFSPVSFFVFSTALPLTSPGKYRELPRQPA